MHQQSAIYLLTDKCHNTLYTGITSNLAERIRKHRRHDVQGFTKRYDSAVLVYYEMYHSLNDAISRRDELKSSPRSKKVQLIESVNPRWTDLYLDVLR